MRVASDYGKSLCLCMIVKDESKTIKSCLDSVADYLDYWIICDTGSVDGTQDIINTYFEERKIPGELHEDKWVDFGHNRSLSLKYAKDKADSLIILDADEVLIVQDTNFKNNIRCSSQNLVKYVGNLDYRCPILVDCNVTWKYVGVTHEHITSDENFEVVKNDDILINHTGAGKHEKSKFTRDIKLLSQGIKDEPDNERYYFYLGQSY